MNAGVYLDAFFLASHSVSGRGSAPLSQQCASRHSEHPQCLVCPAHARRIRADGGGAGKRRHHHIRAMPGDAGGDEGEAGIPEPLKQRSFDVMPLSPQAGNQAPAEQSGPINANHTGCTGDLRRRATRITGLHISAFVASPRGIGVSAAHPPERAAGAPGVSQVSTLRPGRVRTANKEVSRCL